MSAATENPRSETSRDDEWVGGGLFRVTSAEFELSTSVVADVAGQCPAVAGRDGLVMKPDQVQIDFRRVDGTWRLSHTMVRGHWTSGGKSVGGAVVDDPDIDRVQVADASADGLPETVDELVASAALAFWPDSDSESGDAYVARMTGCSGGDQPSDSEAVRATYRAAIAGMLAAWGQRLSDTELAALLVAGLDEAGLIPSGIEVKPGGAQWRFVFAEWSETADE